MAHPRFLCSLRLDILNEVWYSYAVGIIDRTRRKESTVSHEEKLEIAEQNHIWISAFTLVTPKAEMYEAIGRMVVEKLLHSPISDDLSGSFPITWIRLNAS